MGADVIVDVIRALRVAFDGAGGPEARPVTH